ncbi:aminomethyltransferase family protein [Hansschlegelia plantiphila]|uniref:Aminomethyltransferase n=1 Tax=Hansschlegelia plantiphila TaxID=374655 RepID=A0A9W6MU13_9HYPH|nr:aminomethyltransferase family protein [Hansschlegelia plantiphila]GLK66403.1 aminomethyltransferase [Hansschlegelia plantiphila]
MKPEDYPRQSILNERHKALGSKLDGEWNGMPLAQTYATSTAEEVVATRTKAGLIDVSALRLINVKGPDAEKALNAMLTSDMAKLKPGQSAISNLVDENGSLIDDVLVYRNGPDDFRLSHGGGSLEDVIDPFFQGVDATWAKDDDTHVLSLQGPKALEILNPHASIDLSTIKYFEHAPGELFGKSVTLARGGYSAERGYEVFASAADSVEIWDKILEAGAPYGAIATSWSCLDTVRMEGALLFFPFDMPKGDETPWEVGADWTVDLSKPDFHGKEALVRRRQEIRSANVGLEIDAHEAIEPGAKLVKDGRQVGTVNSTTYSDYLMKSIALGSVPPELKGWGTTFEVVSALGTFPAHVVRTPFYDPHRIRTHPLDERG